MPELAAWLFDQIEATTELERLKFIAEILAEDKQNGAEYLADPKVLGILRRAWAEKKAELAIDTETKIGESDCVVVENGTKEELPGKPV